MNKTTLLAFMVCVNLVLLTSLVVFATPTATAQAQGTGLAGNYLVVTGEIQDEFDALYLIDLRERTLHSFYFIKGGTNELRWAGFRDLERDFRNN